MKIIIPMAGMGTRLRPITNITPKPLIKLSGLTILERIINNIFTTVDENITDIAFIVGNFQNSIIQMIKELPISPSINKHIIVQAEPLGTAHALFQAQDLLNGPVIVAYADTIFEAKFKINNNYDGVIFTKRVENPQNYGVVVKNYNLISKFVEKPKEFVSDEAIIGIYYFKNAELLAKKIEYLITNNFRENNEFQITNALQLLLEEKLQFISQIVDIWLDCGTLNSLLDTNNHILSTHQYTSKNYIINNSIVIEPSYIGENVIIENSIIGPFVSIENNSKISNSIISKSIILEKTSIEGQNFSNSIIGNNVILKTNSKQLFLADYDKIS